jgi:hypothetical protein
VIAAFQKFLHETVGGIGHETIKVKPGLYRQEVLVSVLLDVGPNRDEPFVCEFLCYRPIPFCGFPDCPGRLEVWKQGFQYRGWSFVAIRISTAICRLARLDPLSLPVRIPAAFAFPLQVVGVVVPPCLQVVLSIGVPPTISLGVPTRHTGTFATRIAGQSFPTLSTGCGSHALLSAGKPRKTHDVMLTVFGECKTRVNARKC